MAQPAPIPEAISRQELVERLRVLLRDFADQETSICKVAAQKGIFCRGFRRYGDGELRRKYSWIVRKRPELSRDDLEKIANDWQLAQQQVYDVGFACDVQTRLHDTCGGWDDFSNGDLARFYVELTGREVTISEN